MQTRLRLAMVAGLALASFAVVAPATPAAAGGEGPPPVVVGPSGPACTTQTVAFPYAGFTFRTFVVPDGVTQVRVDAFGAEGGDGLASGNGVDSESTPGGLGGHATTLLTVTPGESLQVRVGGQGSSATGTTTADPWAIVGGGIPNGGFNGGGQGAGFGVGGGENATLAAISGSGGGGGASDVRQGGSGLANRVVVAPGGGGGASSSAYVKANEFTAVIHAGGAGGGGGAAGSDGSGTTFGHGGGVGTLVAPGTGGTVNGHDGVGDEGGDGVAQALLLGGNTEGVVSAGGGGGGGWFGGGGGGTSPSPAVDAFGSVGGGGGGGGGSFGPAGVIAEPGVHAGDGSVVFTYKTAGCPSDVVPAAVVVEPHFTG